MTDPQQDPKIKINDAEDSIDTLRSILPSTLFNNEKIDLGNLLDQKPSISPHIRLDQQLSMSSEIFFPKTLNIQNSSDFTPTILNKYLASNSFFNKKRNDSYLQNIAQVLKQNTNISPTNLSTTNSALDLRARPARVLCIASATADTRLSVGRSVSLEQLAQEYAPGTYFPFVIDTTTPDRIYLGIGSESLYRDGRPVGVSDTLIRNGGHIQIATALRGSSLQLTGLYGGGFFIDELGKITIEFKSRGVNGTNGGNTDGLLEEEQADLLEALVREIFTSSQAGSTPQPVTQST